MKEPLANLMRPQNLSAFVGQNHLLGKGKVLRRMIDEDRFYSAIFWGPSGIGKTTLAKIIARQTQAHFEGFSAVVSGIVEVKKIMEEAEKRFLNGQKTILFIDEIHRFNQAQQDAFLPYVEQGSIILIGATTENPSFKINRPLLSRCRVFVLEALQRADLEQILKNALKSAYGEFQIKIPSEALLAIADFANGDARMALNTLELLLLNSPKKGKKITVQNEQLAELLKRAVFSYDQKGEEHHNLISALHKAIRNSDVDASIYWLNRMLLSGEDPLYIARRLVRVAGEDIGLADTNALNVAINVYQACQFLGMPECNVHLTEAVIYLAIVPKSASVYQAVQQVEQIIRTTPNYPVPLHIRNAPTELMKDLNYGQAYLYAHDYPNHITNMPTFPEALLGQKYYYPTEQGHEQRFKERLAWIEAFKQGEK